MDVFRKPSDVFFHGRDEHVEFAFHADEKEYKMSIVMKNVD